MKTLSICLLVIMSFIGCTDAASLDKEAIAIAKKKIIDNQSIKCDGMSYLITRFNYLGEPVEYRRSQKDIQIIVNSFSLTEADKMNGIQWNGVVIAVINPPTQIAQVNLHGVNQQRDSTYGPWQNSSNSIEVQLKKVTGQWHIHYNKVDSKPITCQDAQNPVGSGL